MITITIIDNQETNNVNVIRGFNLKIMENTDSIAFN